MLRLASQRSSATQSIVPSQGLNRHSHCPPNTDALPCPWLQQVQSFTHVSVWACMSTSTLYVSTADCRSTPLNRYSSQNSPFIVYPSKNDRWTASTTSLSNRVLTMRVERGSCWCSKRKKGLGNLSHGGPETPGSGMFLEPEQQPFLLPGMQWPSMISSPMISSLSTTSGLLCPCVSTQRMRRLFVLLSGDLTPRLSKRKHSTLCLLCTSWITLW